MSDQISEVFAEIAALAERLGVAHINSLAACWECQVDEQWWIAVNGHGEPTPTSRGGVAVEPYHAAVEFNGWPAGIVGPYGGIVAAGDAANEDALIAALRKAGRDV